MKKLFLSVLFALFSYNLIAMENDSPRPNLTTWQKQELENLKVSQTIQIQHLLDQFFDREIDQGRFDKDSQEITQRCIVRQKEIMETNSSFGIDLPNQTGG